MITLWHNPRCAKSRAALALLEGRAEVQVRRYLEDAPDEAELRRVHALLTRPVAEMLRRGEAEFRDLALAGANDDALFAAMAAHPRLIERPIAIAAGRAVIGRPPEAVLALL